MDLAARSIFSSPWVSHLTVYEGEIPCWPDDIHRNNAVDVAQAVTVGWRESEIPQISTEPVVRFMDEVEVQRVLESG